MRYSQLFGETSRQVPRDEVSVNAQLLMRAGFIKKEIAGIYHYLPLGLRILGKISQIVREEMNAAGGQEILLSALQNKESWLTTGRWQSFDSLFKVKSRYRTEYALGPTHEEVLVPLVAEFVNSYRDLPLYLYQIQTKFRDEPRAKGGLLRGREFLMKDLYSFHATEDDLMDYYEKMKKTYQKIFKRMSLGVIVTKAGGGTFCQFSHEFQVICENGEDEIIYCPTKVSDEKAYHHFAENVQITDKKAGEICPVCGGKLVKAKTIEVGNIFPLKDKFSKAFNLAFKDKEGRDQLVVMGCYGIGISRLMGAVVEIYHDEAGIIWPKSVAPFQCHLLAISDEPGVMDQAEAAYQKLAKAEIEVLWDDRQDITAGEKFADCDLIGIPVRLVLSEKVGKGKMEWKERDKQQVEVLTIEQVLDRLSD